MKTVDKDQTVSHKIGCVLLSLTLNLHLFMTDNSMRGKVNLGNIYNVSDIVMY